MRKFARMFVSFSLRLFGTVIILFALSTAFIYVTGLIYRSGLPDEPSELGGYTLAVIFVPLTLLPIGLFAWQKMKTWFRYQAPSSKTLGTDRSPNI